MNLVSSVDLKFREPIARTMKLLTGAAVLFSLVAVMYCQEITTANPEDMCIEQNFGMVENAGELERDCGTTNATQIFRMVSLNYSAS